ncbi:PREDICTED: pyridoxal 5'-phosphate synthase-like subunit PDX1.2 [Tarenaya hassleriana]|uniref:pyridoxal 5'-phosphate synthase-like subunit PDX1.2 n=1 Tax=Tarenaya hassleriana TaxID=28532 RepID=UPI00053C7F4F|nr:PREDICTED: pyridoxal 5'-phosphate synthase-like subunit PDX1.2 [Tarenaya hassleriana]
MADQDQSAMTLYGGSAITDAKNHHHSFSVKIGIAQMLRGGAIVEVSSVDQAKIAESAGACAVVVVPSGPGAAAIRRMPDPGLVKEVKRAVSVPVMGRARVGHFVEAQILESLAVDYIDESEILAIADEDNFINKHNFRSPFICGCRNLGEALRRIREGAAMIRVQGEVTPAGNISETVRNVRTLMGDVRMLNNMDEDEVFTFAKNISAPYDLVVQTKQMGRLPVVQFASGGITIPADAAMMMQLGCDGIFVGSEIFDGPDPFKKLRSIVQAVRHYNDPHVLVEMSSGLDTAMGELSIRDD